MGFGADEGLIGADVRCWWEHGMGEAKYLYSTVSWHGSINGVQALDC